jgi:hypothetical protein
MTSAKLAIAAFAMGANLSAFAATNLIKNGGFEAPPITPGTVAVYTVGQTIGAWQVVGVAFGNVAVDSGTVVDQQGITYTARAGQQWIDLTGAASNSASGLQQSVKTVVGKQYVLKFSVGNVVSDGPAGLKSSVDVVVNGVVVATATYSGGNATSLTWKSYQKVFVATTKRTTIAFINADDANDHTMGLDAVSLTESVTD